MTDHARNAIGNYQFAREARQREAFDNIMSDSGKQIVFSGDEQALNQKAINIPAGNQTNNSAAAQQDDGIDFENDLLEINNREDAQPGDDDDGYFRAVTVEPREVFTHAKNQTMTGEDRAIKGNASGQYVIPEDHLLEDYDFVDDLENGELAETADTALINNVMQGYEQVMLGGIEKQSSVLSTTDSSDY